MMCKFIWASSDRVVGIMITIDEVLLAVLLSSGSSNEFDLFVRCEIFLDISPPIVSILEVLIVSCVYNVQVSRITVTGFQQ